VLEDNTQEIQQALDNHNASYERSVASGGCSTHLGPSSKHGWSLAALAALASMVRRRRR
jgi:hypothetical protein